MKKIISEVDWLKAHHANQKRNAEGVYNYIDALESIVVSLAAPLPENGFNAVMEKLTELRRWRHDETMGSFSTFLRLGDLGWEPNESLRFGEDGQHWVNVNGDDE
jgi:hypothetical protein